VCSNGKRTSILEYVAISVKKMSIFVVLHRWGTGTLLVLLVDWLGTAQDTGSHQSRTETPKPKAPANNSSWWWLNERQGRRRRQKTRMESRAVAIDECQWIGGGRTDGWTDGRATKRTHRGRRKRPKTMAISSSIFCDFVSLFRNFLILLFLI
jgi:hypothetical protein